LNFKSIEFLRTFSALGVVWIHVWTFFRNPTLNLFSVDLFKVVSFVGNGVDFFFVISGFLMFLALQNKDFSIITYWTFIKKRFFRIAPLYYVSILVYFSVFNFFLNHQVSLKSVLIDALFLNNYFKDNIAYTFWSLAVEWGFYLIVPFLFIFKDLKKRLITFSLLVIVSFIRLFQLEWNADLFLTPDMPFPLFIEFGCGILIGFILTNEKWKTSIRINQTWLNLFIGFSILYAGRLMRLTEIVQHTGQFSILFKVFSGPVLTFGFAYIMYMLISNHGKFSKFAEQGFFQFLGRLSYGVYLWHVLFISFLPLLFKPTDGPYIMIIAFLLVSLCSVGLSWLTYEIIEKRYFTSKLSSKHIR
jgi:peptidoglycan/LPS O-acetylase OafA/YrhL